MNDFIKVLKRVNPSQFWKIFLLGLRNPVFVIPTMTATKRCMQIATHLYGNAHKKNGPENAFRHVLWNYLIAKKCFKWWDDEEYVLRWTQKITDWHESSFPNKDLARRMDLHNNEVGRTIFRLHANKTENQVLEMIKEMTKQSKIISTKSDFSNLTNTMVHITQT